MTSTADTAEHPEVTELSDLTEGLLPPSRTPGVRRHLDECPLCADEYASLEEIRDTLGTLPGPSRMPADIASRIDAALAAEALLNATAPGSDATKTPISVSTSRSDRDEDSGTHVSRETAPSTDRPADRSPAATSPGRTARKRRGRRRTVALGTVFTAATLGFSALLAQSLGDGNSSDSPAAAQSQEASPNTFSGDTLKNQVENLLAQSKRESNASADKETWSTATKSPGSTTEKPQNTFKATDVPHCVTEGIGRSEAPLASKEGKYERAAAYLVVLPGISDTDRVTAYVVDASCVDKTSVSPGDVLAQRSYPYPSPTASTSP